MKRVLVTGGTGFLGCHVVNRLRKNPEYTVIPIGSKLFDLRMHGDVEFMYEELQPDIVINLAARCGGIKANRVRPAEFFYDNLMIGVNLIHNAPARLEKFVQIGSVCSYPVKGCLPFREDQLWDGYPESTNAPYGIAKRTLLTMCQAYRQQYGLNAIYLMPANLYGPGDNFDPETSHVISASIQKCIEARRTGEDVALWGTGFATREFLFVEDCAEAIALAVERYNDPEPVNIATGEEISISGLVTTIAELVGYTGDFYWDSTKPDGQPRRKFETLRASSFGFRASTSLREGLKKTIDWYLETQCGK
jgi:GDP-L-fucose synthase